jgi:2-phosphoglycerate kinase
MRSVVASGLVPSIHRSSFEPDANRRFTDAADTTCPQPPPTEQQETIGALVEQVRHVAVAVDAVLERAVQENLSTILEGVHLIPGLFERFAAENRVQFLHVVVHLESETEHRDRFVSRGRATQGRPGERYLRNFSAIRTIQSYLVERATACGLPCINNSRIDDTVDAVLGHVLEGVGASTPWMPPVRR